MPQNSLLTSKDKLRRMSEPPVADNSDPINELDIAGENDIPASTGEKRQARVGLDSRRSIFFSKKNVRRDYLPDVNYLFGYGS